ncbi:unnamed protein product [Didymodactylos carnosus]|uniref:Uncharacterized protein n=1 Tax=Didymodactylos carnosus TaxID=1234261 RepID=A0A816FKU2_9BILA|nr:unnamed protein product [Didymodactylos carnosus]CAF4615147.1 unnamed protein product [Didymodactylos carnosus]
MASTITMANISYLYHIGYINKKANLVQDYLGNTITNDEICKIFGSASEITNIVGYSKNGVEKDEQIFGKKSQTET